MTTIIIIMLYYKYIVFYGYNNYCVFTIIVFYGYYYCVKLDDSITCMYKESGE